MSTSKVIRSIFTKNQKKRLSLEFRKLLLYSQKKNNSLVYKFYKSNFDKAIQMFKEDENPNNQNFAQLFNKEDIHKLNLELYNDITKRYFNWYKKHLVKSIPKQQDEADVEYATDKFIQDKENYIATGANIKTVQDTALVELRSVLQAKLDDPEFMALGIEDRVRILTKDMDFKARWMAKRIIRTESTAAANLGVKVAAENIFGTDMLQKEWIATMDDRGRPAHQAYSGTILPFNEPYSINNQKMMFPSDMTMGAAAKEIVNCRCFSAPFVATEYTEQQALAIRKE